MHEKIRIPRWYYLYFLLAAFYVIAVGVSLYLNHNVMNAYEVSVHQIQVLTQYQNALLKLNDQASLMNAPGNDVFRTGDADAERIHFLEQKNTFETQLATVRLMTEKNFSPNTSQTIIQQLNIGQQNTDALVDHAMQLFDLFKAGQQQAAAAQMAEMDNHFSQLSRTISTAIQIVGKIAQSDLDEQVNRTQQMRKIEIAIALMVLVMVAGATLYGYSISKRIRRDIYIQQTRKLHLDAVVNTTVDAIVTIDAHGTIQDFNTAAEKTFGYTKAEVIGQNVNILMPEPHRSAHNDYLKHYLSTGEAKIIGIGREIVGVRKDGSMFPMALAVGTFTIRDQTTFVGSIRDISERKEAENQLRDYAAKMEAKSQELAAAKEVAEQASRLKSEFLANMSHEIRTPMNGVIGMTNLLLDTELTSVQQGYANIISRSADNLLEVINDILDFSKIEAGKIELEHVAFNMRRICDEVCEMMAIKANEKGLELLCRYAHDTPTNCIGDPVRVRQILINLTNNAIKFTAQGHIILTVHASFNEDTSIRFHFEVEDTGIGIPADKTELIFNKFSQADQSTSRQFGGTGLGLSISRELTQMMGGTIGVRSTYGAGSTFWFDIVLEQDAADHPPLVLQNHEILKGLRVLVVDDNEISRIIIREQLSPYGIEVIGSDSGVNALKRLETDTPYDIAILDFMMPNMDGAELGQALKTNPLTRDMLLIMLTSAPSPAHKGHMEEIGFSGYFSKPLGHQQLHEALSIIIESKKLNKTSSMLTQHDLHKAKISTHTDPTQKFSDAHILLVEDNAINQMIALSILEKHGCQVTIANNGNEAIERLQQEDLNFDLIFMDCQMPEMDGYEATGIIRKLEAQHHHSPIPIIAFTANAIKGDEEKCLLAGMDDYIPKPVNKNNIQRVLNTWLPIEKRQAHESIS